MKDQLADKQELIEQFESHLTGLTDQHNTQIQEMQTVVDQLKIKIVDFEAQIRDRNQELDQT